jgi:hypothetical protein
MDAGRTDDDGAEGARGHARAKEGTHRGEREGKRSERATNEFTVVPKLR